jgi:DNA-binding transcriptional ArsR family regulator
VHRGERHVPRVSAAAVTSARQSASEDVLDSMFGALADPTRRRLLFRLVGDGPASATVLAAASPLTRQAVVKHLQALEAAGLVVPERVGREVRYRADPGPLAAAVGWLLDAGASWDRRIDRLRTASAAPAAPAARRGRGAGAQ